MHGTVNRILTSTQTTFERLVANNRGNNSKDATSSKTYIKKKGSPTYQCNFQFYFFPSSFLPNFIATDILISPSKCLTLTIFLGISEFFKTTSKASQEKPIEQTQPVQIQNLEVNSTKNSQMIIIVKLPMIILNSPIKPNHLSRC